MASERRPVELEDFYAFVTAGDAQISPDGARVAYVVTRIDRDADETRSAIWVVPFAGGEAVQLNAGTNSDSAPRWSPDGRWLAFLSNREGKPQLYALPTAGGEPRQLTRLEDGAGPAVWSPDSQRIAFTAPVQWHEPPKDPKERERWSQRPREVKELRFKADGAGFVADRRSQIFVVDLDGSEPRRLMESVFQDRDPAWSPDCTTIACISARHEGRELSNLAELWLVPADGSPGEPRSIARLAGMAAPSFSPDGRTVALYATSEHERVFDVPHHVWLAPVAGDARARDLTPGFDRGAVAGGPTGPAAPPAWIDGGRRIVFLVADRGDTNLYTVDVADGVVTPVAAREQTILAWSVAREAGRAAVVFADREAPPDVASVDLASGVERRLTRLNDAILAELKLFPPQRRRFQTPHGEVEGWVLRDPDARRPGPLLLDVHGGPHGYFSGAFPLNSFYWLVAAARGWTVVGINPSGSSSYGLAFEQALRGRWGEYDLPEQLAVVDALIAEGVADPERLAITGYSYGGYLSSWAVGQTDRFRAAVIGAPLTNLESACTTGDVLPGLLASEMGGETLQSQREVFRRLSPVQYLERVTTPCLILQGEADNRCPISQGEELLAGLRALGKTAEMVRYPGASHGFRVQGRPSHRLDYSRRVLDWIERWVIAAPARESTPEPAAAAAGDG